MSASYAVIGHPIAHSLSPRIHRYFAQQTNQDMVYNARLAPLDGFAASVKQFRDQGGQGANVTVPFKVEAYQLAEQLTPRATLAQAVNTISWQTDAHAKETLLGDNTDGVGLLRDLTDNLQINLQEVRLLILGAGGAVRGVLAPLLAAGAHITLNNRTPQRAIELISQFSSLGKISLSSEVKTAPFDIIINATSASLQNNLPCCKPEWIDSNTLCYDMVYANDPTPFIRFAKTSGAKRCADGLGMLIEQAAEAFFVWRGIRPNTTELIKTRLFNLTD